jgi:hypothetical protein
MAVQYLLTHAPSGEYTSPKRHLAIHNCDWHGSASALRLLVHGVISRHPMIKRRRDVADIFISYSSAALAEPRSSII